MRKPSTICIELTTACNMRCAYCPLDKEITLPPRTLQRELLEQIIEQIPGDWHPQIELGGFGESMLHSDLQALVATMKALRPDLYVSTSTNALLLSPELIVALDQAGLDEMTVSINSIAHIQHDPLIRYRTPHQKVLELRDILLAARRSIQQLRLSVQIFEHHDRASILAWKELLAGVFDRVYLQKVSNWNSLVTPPTGLVACEEEVSDFYDCTWSESAMMIDAEGYYALCCAHLAVNERACSVFDLPLPDFWAQIQDRQAHLIFADVDTWCNNCTNGRNQHIASRW